MAKRLSAQELAEKYVRRTTAATEDMKRGVASVTVNPAEKAIAKKDKLKTNFIASIDNGKWERGMRNVTLASWQEAMSGKGAQRVAAGVQAAQAKMEKFFAELLPFQQDLQSRIATMSDLTLEDSVARASAWIRGMANFKRNSRG